jgi:hypothetical protein
MCSDVKTDNYLNWNFFVICLFLNKNRGKYKYKKQMTCIYTDKATNLLKQHCAALYRTFKTKDSFIWQPLCREQDIYGYLFHFSAIFQIFWITIYTGFVIHTYIYINNNLKLQLLD